MEKCRECGGELLRRQTDGLLTVTKTCIRCGNIVAPCDWPRWNQAVATTVGNRLTLDEFTRIHRQAFEANRMYDYIGNEIRIPVQHRNGGFTTVNVPVT